MTEFHVIGLDNPFEFVIKDVDNDCTYATFSACDSDRDSMEEFVDYVNRIIKENENFKLTSNLWSNEEFKRLKKKNYELKEENLTFFQQVNTILLKYQHLFNREMADEVLEELGIELTRWFKWVKIV